jgi:hypothetical protein
MFKIIQPHLISTEMRNDKLNQLELSVLAECPILQRIATHQRPIVIQGWVPKNHNCDFILLDAMFVEVKGMVRDGMYRSMIAHFPDWLKARYHIVNCENNKQRREALSKYCAKHGVSISEGPTVPPWVVQKALDLGPMADDPRIQWLTTDP